ncbi:MAG: hypothetical protein IPJ76_18260 [Flavobacteriales bacterium]|nr:MAG: hypothetical protein IPJ76_18260 [Flavobacteriales bacterium]
MFPKAQRLLRTGLLACVMLLGFQFLLPHALHAMGHVAMLEEGVVPPLVQEEEGAGAGIDEDHLTLAFGPEHLRIVQLRQAWSIVHSGNAQRPLVAFLHASGLQPSAP